MILAYRVGTARDRTIRATLSKVTRSISLFVDLGTSILSLANRKELHIAYMLYDTLVNSSIARFYTDGLRYEHLESS
jgi:hypothetical protein